MGPIPSHDLSIAERIDLSCDRFEAEFTSGKHPRLEHYLGDADDPLRIPLFRGLLELELELRRRAGELPQREEYKQRFEPYAAVVELVFAEVGGGTNRRLSDRAAGDSSVKAASAETSRSPSRSPAGAGRSQIEIARFRIDEKLGEGAFGAVYKARDPQLDRDVAIKVPHAGALSTNDDRERFLREARAAGGLHHANICPVYEVGSTPDGRDYIVMAYIDGKPLSKVLQSGTKISDRQIAAVIRKLALALEEAHQKGVIHRDLKPANIMTNRKGEPVIMDFGLARRSTPNDMQISFSGQIMGTPAYMSPEQARGDSKNIGPAADIYSLGVVLYEMLCGHRPFTGTVTEVIGMILHVDAPPPSHFKASVDPKLQAICMRAIAKNPADRYASMKDFAAALSEFIKASSATPVPATHEPAVLSEFANLGAILAAGAESQFHPEQAHQPLDRDAVPWWRDRRVQIAGGLGIALLLGVIVMTIMKQDGARLPVKAPGDVQSVDNTQDGNSVAEVETSAVPGDVQPVDNPPDGQPVAKVEVSTPNTGNQAGRANAPPLATAPFSAEQARLHQEAWAKHLGLPVEYTNSIGMKFRLIPPGEYTMGTPPEQIETALALGGMRGPEHVKTEQPARRVRLSRPMYFGVYEVTKGDFTRFADQSGYKSDAEKDGKGSPPDLGTKAGINSIDWRQPGFEQTENHPVVNVSATDTLSFCDWLSRTEGISYRIPREAEWEFACRAGTTTQFYGGDDQQAALKLGNMIGGSDGFQFTAPVGSFLPNAFGLFDMCGNVWEGCRDFSTPNYAGHNLAGDPPIGGNSSEGIGRGGASDCPAAYCRSAVRSFGPRQWRSNNLGFRVICEVTEHFRPPPALSWTDPVQIGANVDLPDADDHGVGAGPGDLSIFFGRRVSGEEVAIWHANRLHQNAEFGPAVRAKFNSDLGDGCPVLTSDGLTIYWDSARDGSWDIWTAKRKSLQDEFASPGKLSGRINTNANEFKPAVTGDELTLVYSHRVNNLFTIAVSNRTTTDEEFGVPMPLGPNVNTDGIACDPAISPDGLHLIFASDRPGGYGGLDLWLSSRATREAEFGPATNLGPKINTAGGDDKPNFSSDGQALYFTSRRGPGKDIWVSRRETLATAPASPSPTSAPTLTPAAALVSADQAHQQQQDWAKRLGVPVEYTNSIGMKFRLVPPGEYLRGSTPEEIQSALSPFDPRQPEWTEWRDAMDSQGPQHRVVLTRPIYLGKHEVTQKDYRKVMGKNPSFFAKTGTNPQLVVKVLTLDTANHPVENVSWYDAAEFCAKLSQLEKRQPFYARSGDSVSFLDNGDGYRLPTEAEWEFACRAGKTTTIWKDKDLARVGWVNRAGRTYPVGQLPANSFGLHDMHGNIWEWCSDWYDAREYLRFEGQTAQDPLGPRSGSSRVLRGGSWISVSSSCWSTYREPQSPDKRGPNMGFRVALVLPAEAESRSQTAIAPASTDAVVSNPQQQSDCPPESLALPASNEDSMCSTTTAAAPAPQQNTEVRVLVLNFDPLVDPQKKIRLHEFCRWNDPHLLAQQHAADVKEASGGRVTFKFVDWEDLDEFPVKSDGFAYTLEGYLNCWRTNKGWHQPDQADYPKLIEKYGLVEQVERGEVDEIWWFAFPYAGFGESAMAGRGAFGINGPAFDAPQVKCQRPFAIMGFNYERGPAEMIHNLSHRTEATMTRIFGGWQADKLDHDWARFAANAHQSRGIAAVGSCHYPPNGVKDYDYDNKEFVDSTADDWKNYPQLTGVKTKVNCESWGGPDYQRNYLKWWFARLPRAAGVNESSGRLNDWWEYVYGLHKYDVRGKPIAQ